jgi:hypothetical protein
MDRDELDFTRLYAQYGRAFYKAQVVEKVLQSVVLLYNKTDDKITDEELKLISEVRKTESLGELMKNLGKLWLEDKLYADLKTAAERRNYLAHEFFWDKWKMHETRQGIEESVGELERDCIKLFESIQTRLLTLMAEWVIKTKDVNAHVLEALQAGIGSRDRRGVFSGGIAVVCGEGANGQGVFGRCVGDFGGPTDIC